MDVLNIVFSALNLLATVIVGFQGESHNSLMFLFHLACGLAIASRIEPSAPTQVSGALRF